MTFVARRVTDQQLRTIVEDDSAAEKILFGDGPELDLDKAWHAIHFLLTGSAWEVGAGAGAAILGGEPIGGDIGHGPVRLLLPEEVKAIVPGLVDTDELRRRFDPMELTEAGVYPNVWDESDFDHYVGPNYASLRDFYRRAAENDQAVVLGVA